MLAQVRDRLEDRVDTLRHRVDSATGLSDILRNRTAPRAFPAAYVVPLAMAGTAPEVSTGFYVQPITETVGVVLFARGGTPTGDQALNGLRPLLDAIIAALVGWAPGDQSGVFVFRAGRLISFAEGLLIYQLEFVIDDQLRIAT